MSQVKVTKEEFADIIMILFLDAVRDEDVIKSNPRFRDIMEHAKSHGFKGKLLTNYLHMDAQTRVHYKRIKDAFHGNDSARIDIGGSQVSEEFDRDLCKRIFRKVKDVRFKTSKPITEERLNKIIDYCINEKEEQNNG